MRTTKGFINVIVCLAIVLFLTVGCKSKSPNTSDIEKKEPIKIGAILPLTGPFAVYGEPVRHGMMIALEEINSKGGINGKKLSLIMEDNAGNPKSAVNAFNKLSLADRVPMILGPLSSGSSMATAPIANKSKVIQLSTLAGIPDLTGAGDYVFRIYPSSELGAKFAADKAIKLFKPMKIAVLYMNNPFGLTAKKTYEDISTASGIKVVATESFQDGEKDFRTQLSKIKSSSPDIIFCSAYWQDGATIIVQMQELGMNMPVFGEDGWRGPIANIVGEQGLKQLYFADISFGSEFKDNVIMQKFIDTFERKFKRKASTYAATGYDAVYIAMRALEVGGWGDSESLKKALYDIKYNGALGSIRFDENGDNIGLQFSIFQINDKNEGILVNQSKEGDHE